MLTREYIKETDSSLTKMARTDASRVYRLTDGRVAKYLTKEALYIYALCGSSLQNKLEASSVLSDVKEIVLPTSLIETDDGIVGYTMPFIEGKTFNEKTDSLTLEEKKDLPRYLTIHRKLNELVKKCNERGVVLPDLLTCDNIMFKENGDITLIDVDGLQIGTNSAPALSTSLGDPRYYQNNKKYCKDPRTLLWTEELDKKSLMYLFFLDILNCDLSKVGAYNPKTRQKITLDSFFNQYGMDSVKMQRIVKTIIDDQQKGEYLDRFYDLAEKRYNLDAIPADMLFRAFGIPQSEEKKGLCIKKLIRR